MPDLLVPKASEAFWSLVAKHPDPKVCWPWLGAKKPQGYGVYKARGSFLAHRIAWAGYWGIEPGAFVVRHLCYEPACCNPSHLRLGTSKQNEDDKFRSVEVAWCPGCGAAERRVTDFQDPNQGLLFPQ